MRIPILGMLLERPLLAELRNLGRDSTVPVNRGSVAHLGVPGPAGALDAVSALIDRLRERIEDDAQRMAGADS